MNKQKEAKIIEDIRKYLLERGIECQNPPVNMDAIAAAYDITINESPRLDSIDKIGIVSNVNSIWINPLKTDEYTSLRRHVIAYELAHIILHKKELESGLLFQDSYKGIKDSYYKIETNDAEKNKAMFKDECNQFAAELLIPTKPLLELVPVLQSNNDCSTEIVFRRIAEAFDVPISLVRRKIISYASGINANCTQSV